MIWDWCCMSESIEIIVKDSQKKTSKNDKEFLAVTTDKGRMSCWNPQIFSQLIAGKKLLVKFEGENGYKNILGIEQELTPEIKAVTEYVDDKATMMLVSYIKDVVIAHMQISKEQFNIDDLYNFHTLQILKCCKEVKEKLHGS